MPAAQSDYAHSRKDDLMSLMKQIVATVAVVTLSVGAAVAAPVTNVYPGAGATVAAPATVQPVYWVWRHHHKVWIPDHHRH
jgi:hypothetical protein